MISAKISVSFQTEKGIGSWSAQINSPSEDPTQPIKRLSGSYESSSLREIELISTISVLSLLPEGNKLAEVSINSSYVLDGLDYEINPQRYFKNLWSTLIYLNSRRNIAWKLPNQNKPETLTRLTNTTQEISTFPRSRDTTFIAYTDGSCLGNPGKGGWGVVVEAWEHGQKMESYDLSGFEPKTTNNRMELTGAIKVLEYLPDNSEITILTDSKYLYDGITGWIVNWKSNYWMTASKKPVKNKDLWVRLDEVSSNHRVKWKWVKGHHISEGNNRADKLATSAAEGEFTN